MNVAPEGGCFACAGDGPRIGRVRLLCAEHTAACRLPDGALLRAVLANARPLDAPLEGSLLGWLYNPVHVEDGTGVLRRGWTDFAGGGMGVLEDVFGARQVFDLWTIARPEGIALLRDVGGALPAEIQRRLQAPEGPHRRFAALAHSMWRQGLAIQARRTSLGRWPESFRELLDVLGKPDDEPGQGGFENDAEFAAYVAALAERCLPALPPG